MPYNNVEWIPFLNAPWSAQQKQSFDHIIRWDNELKTCSLGDLATNKIKDVFEEEAALITRGVYGGLIPDAVCRSVLEDAEQHGLPLEWFISQVRSAHYYYGPLRFSSGTELKQFLQDSVIPQGYLIAKLADVAHRWQLPQVSDLTTAFFLVKKLVHLKDDLKKDRLFIPLLDMDQAGVTVNDLKQGNNHEQMQKMLWKQVVRIRDAFAQGQPLVKEVPRKFRRSFKKNWLTGLELVSEIERRNYDLWSNPIILSSLQQIQIRILSFIGKGAAHARGRS